MKIRKRNGQEVKFTKTNIIKAIKQANDVVNIQERLTDLEIKEIANEIEEKCKNSIITMNVEDIQNLVEHAIFEKGKFELAKEYISYRYIRNLERRKNTTDDRIISLLNNNNEEIHQENANKNPNIVSTMRDYMAGEVSKDISRRYLIPKDIIKAHDEGVIHFHDMDYFSMPIHNCCLINLDDMLQNGTVISGTSIDKPKLFSTACNIASQIVAQVASSQYGGQTITASHLSKFVKDSRKYFYNNFKESLPDLSPEQLELLVENETKRDIKNGIQTLQYQLITLQTTNGQTPFVTLNLYLNEAENETEKEDLAIVIEEVLKQRIKGVKNEVGAFYANPFPKLIYVLEEDNISEDSKYYYLTKLAAVCTTKRMVPDYVSEKTMLNLKIDKNGNGNCYPPMGCVEGSSNIKIKVKGKIENITIEEMWNKYAKNIKHQHHAEDNPNLYSELVDIEIYDNVLDDFTKCKMINRNVNNNWVLLKLKSDEEKCEIVCTDNHIWTNIDGVDKTTNELTLNDKIWYSKNKNELIEMKIDTMISFSDDKPSFDVTTESEHFEVNGLYSHNCRSFLTPYVEPETKKTLVFEENDELDVSFE